MPAQDQRKPLSHPHAVRPLLGKKPFMHVAHRLGYRMRLIKGGEPALASLPRQISSAPHACPKPENSDSKYACPNSLHYLSKTGELTQNVDFRTARMTCPKNWRTHSKRGFPNSSHDLSKPGELKEAHFPTARMPRKQEKSP